METIKLGASLSMGMAFLSGEGGQGHYPAAESRGVWVEAQPLPAAVLAPDDSPALAVPSCPRSEPLLSVLALQFKVGLTSRERSKNMFDRKEKQGVSLGFLWKSRSGWTRRAEEGSSLRFLAFMQLGVGQSHKRARQQRY